MVNANCLEVFELQVQSKYSQGDAEFQWEAPKTHTLALYPSDALYGFGLKAK